MSTNNRNIENEGDFEQDKNVSGRPQGTNTGPVAGGADNTRGENKPSQEGSGGGAKKGKANDDQANLTTTTRGSDSTDKEFRNDQPNASTLKTHKSNVDIKDQKK